MSELLSQLYTSMGHYREAMGVHENILRLVVEGDDGDDSTFDTMDSERVKHHVDLLKQCYLRLHGWDKSPAVYEDLVHAILGMEEHRNKPEWQGVQGAEHWDYKKEAASESVGKFFVPQDWEFEDRAKIAKRPGLDMKRATSNCGLNYFMYDGLDGVNERSHQHGNGNGAKKGEAAKTVIFDGDDDGYESAAEEVGEYQSRDGDGVSGKTQMFTRGVDGVCA